MIFPWDLGPQRPTFEAWSIGANDPHQMTGCCIQNLCMKERLTMMMMMMTTTTMIMMTIKMMMIVVVVVEGQIL
jgi:hypothetical protein